MLTDYQKRIVESQLKYDLKTLGLKKLKETSVRDLVDFYKVDPDFESAENAAAVHYCSLLRKQEKSLKASKPKEKLTESKAFGILKAELKDSANSNKFSEELKEALECILEQHELKELIGSKDEFQIFVHRTSKKDRLPVDENGEQKGDPVVYGKDEKKKAQEVLKKIQKKYPDREYKLYRADWDGKEELKEVKKSDLSGFLVLYRSKEDQRKKKPAKNSQGVVLSLAYDTTMKPDANIEAFKKYLKSLGISAETINNCEIAIEKHK